MLISSIVFTRWHGSTCRDIAFVTTVLEEGDVAWVSDGTIRKSDGGFL